MAESATYEAASLAYTVVRDLGSYVYQVYSDLDSPSGRKLLKDFKQAKTVRRIAILGLGGTGKTTLLKTLTDCPQIDPRISNLGITPVVYRFKEPDGWIKRGDHHVFLFMDCEGQRFDKWAIALASNDADKLFDMGTFDAVVFVVDLLAAPENPEITDGNCPIPDFERLRSHVDEWSNTALDFVYANLGDRLKYSALFTNKTNLIEELAQCHPRRMAHQEEIKDILAPLSSRLRQRSRGHLFEYFIGDASSQKDTEGLRKLILETEEQFDERTRTK